MTCLVTTTATTSKNEHSSDHRLKTGIFDDDESSVQSAVESSASSSSVEQQEGQQNQQVLAKESQRQVQVQVIQSNNGDRDNGPRVDFGDNHDDDSDKLEPSGPTISRQCNMIPNRR